VSGTRFIFVLRMTRLTVPITACSLDEALLDIKNAAQRQADQIEIRLDYFDSVSARMDFAELVRSSPLPILWTLRHASEGGKFTGSLSEQIDILLAAISVGGEYIDIEFARWLTAGNEKKRLLNTIAELRKTGQTIKLILSSHNFTNTPPNLSELFEKIAADPHADIAKIACTANSITDNFAVFDILKNASKPAIAIAMKPLGAISRILARKFNAELTFASLADGKGSAPGQLTLETMKNEFNYNHIGPETLIAGVVGDPVEHSLSPLIHNLANLHDRVNSVYVKFEVAKSYDNFCGFIDALRARPWLNMMGLSITIPHKTNALQYLKDHHEDVDPLAEKIGAVNTLTFHIDGSLSGANTDYLGVLETLRCKANLASQDLAGKRVAVLGAGGVCRAIVAAMTSADADVTIYNRTEEKAHALADDFHCRYQPWESRNSLSADILINGTSLGLHPNSDISPLEPAALKPGMIVFDTVYNPLETKLLRLARERGAQPIDGANMLVFQAAEQIKIWRKAQQKGEISIPTDIMKEAMLSRLNLTR
jgi:3-dehydroquinate dehydratase/shikimate dehydrogenase